MAARKAQYLLEFFFDAIEGVGRLELLLEANEFRLELALIFLSQVVTQLGGSCIVSDDNNVLEASDLE